MRLPDLEFLYLHSRRGDYFHGNFWIALLFLPSIFKVLEILRSKLIKHSHEMGTFRNYIKIILIWPIFIISLDQKLKCQSNAAEGMKPPWWQMAYSSQSKKSPSLALILGKSFPPMVDLCQGNCAPASISWETHLFRESGSFWRQAGWSEDLPFFFIFLWVILCFSSG